MSVSSEVQRTLVKSPPELWAELSDPASLASHLGELGEIRIVRTVPETTVEWEAPEVTGRVQIKPSAWGTKVTLSVTGELPQVESQGQSGPPREVASFGEPATSSSVSTGPAPAAEIDSPPRTNPEPAAEDEIGSVRADDTESKPKAEPDGTRPAGAESRPAPETESLSSAGVESEPKAAPESAGPADAKPGPAGETGNAGELGPGQTPEPPEGQPRQALRGRFLRRAWHSLRRRRPVRPLAPAVVELQSTEDPLPETAPAAAGEPPPAVSPSEPGQQRVAPGPGEQQVAPEPIAMAAGEPAGAASAAGSVPAQSHGSDGAVLDGPAKQTADAPPDLGELERRTAEQMTAVLMSMLDRLGAAHHRPFSRA